MQNSDSKTKRVAVRGVVRFPSVLFFLVGGGAALKGIWDSFFGAPEANVFSPVPWSFVTREEWLRFAGFELAFGLACVGVGLTLWVWSRELPLCCEIKSPRVAGKDDRHG